MFQKSTKPTITTQHKVRLKGKPIPDTDGYVKGISHLNSNLTIMPGLTHLRFDHIRQIYIGQIEIINIGNTSFSFEKSQQLQNIFMLQRRMQNKLSSGRVWWKKIAEKRKERCKLHSMARVGNVKKTKSLTCLFMNRFQAHICQCDTKCKSRKTHTNKSTHKRHKNTTSLRKGTTDDISTNKFTG